MFRQWGTGNRIGAVYVIEKSRLGNNDKQPKDNGEVAICVQHSGDCFFDYVVLRESSPGYWKTGLQFGAYAFSTEANFKLSDRQFHLLLAGEKVRLQSPRIA